VSGSSNGASVDVRVFLWDVAPPTKVDLVATELRWDTARGGVDFAYEVRNDDLPSDATIKFYWYDVGGAQRGEVRGLRTRLQKDSTLAQSGPHQLGRPIHPGVPSGATSLRMVVDDGDAIDEASESNNTLSLAYEPRFALVAKYDGAASPDVIGRFFTGPVIFGQNVTFTLPESLAAFKPTQISARLGSRDLPVTSTGGRSYVTGDFDPSGLRQDTDLVIEVKSGSIVLHSERALVDVEPIPDWLYNSLSRKDFGFEPSTGKYTFAGTLLNFTTSSLNGFALPGNATIPGDNWFGIGKKTGLDARATLEIKTGLNPTEGPDSNVHLNVDLVFLGRSVYRRSYDSKTGTPLSFSSDLNPKTLEYTGATLSYHETGTRTVDVLKDETFTKKYFSLKSAVTANLTHELTLTVSFGPNGSITNSDIGFDLHGVLSGNFLDVTIAADGDALKLLQGLTKGSPQGILTSLVTSALQNLGILPSARIRAGVTGNLNLNGHAKLISSRGARFESLTGNIDLGITADVAMTWDVFFDETWLFGLPKAMTDMLKISRIIP
jgi:hypothetical protein